MTIRVLVVEDSATVRQHLRAALAAGRDFEIVGEAENGAQAVQMCRRLRPDVITMDVVLPVLSGLIATEQIMASQPTPILVVCSTDRREVFTTYDALAAGAVDVLEKPRGDASDATWAQRLRSAVRIVSRIKVVTRHRPLPAPPALPAPSSTPTRPTWPGTPAGPAPVPGTTLRLVAIGASTGGPGAIVQLLRSLPADYPVPLLYVQHLAANEAFATAFTSWLAEQTGRSVLYARGAEHLATLAGQVVMAPPDRHLLVHGSVLHLSSAPERHSCRPSVDTLFESAAELGSAAVGCLLTGMGRDGAAGLLAMRRAGARTYAQDQASSVVYGMPHEAALLGAAAELLPPDQIADRLAKLVAGGAERAGWRTPF